MLPLLSSSRGLSARRTSSRGLSAGSSLWIALLCLQPSLALADAPVVNGHPVASVSSSNGIVMSGSQAPAPASINTPMVASDTTQTPDQALVTADDVSDTPSMMTDVNKRDPASQIILLQQQIQELRGQLEEQGHAIAQLQAQQNVAAPNTAVVAPTVTSSAVTSNAATSASPAAMAETPTAASATAAAVATTTAVASANTNTNASEEQMYQDAYKLVAAKQYSKATVALQTYLQQYPNGQYAATSHYWLGELALIEGNLPQAQNQFNTVVTQFPQSPKAADSMLKIGMIYYNQSQWKQARAQFTALNSKFPNSASAQLAQQQLKQMQRQGN